MGKQSIEELHREVEKLISKGYAVSDSLNHKLKKIVSEWVSEYKEDLDSFNAFNKHIGEEITQLVTLVRIAAGLHVDIHQKVGDASAEDSMLSLSELKKELEKIKTLGVDNKKSAVGAIAKAEIIITKIDEMVTYLSQHENKENFIHEEEREVFEYAKAIKELVKMLKERIKKESE
jgi:hypothetical protein